MSRYVDKVRHLVVVCGDQLDGNAAAFDGFDDGRDAALMMELDEEARYIPQHRLRLVLFFSAMRHFAAEQRGRGRRVHYAALDDANNRGSFDAEVVRWGNKARPEKLICTQPGDHRVEDKLRRAADELGVPLELRADGHFICSRQGFAAFAEGRKTLVMENFYRQMRREHEILLDGDGKPAGGQWNFDEDNRQTFGKDGPGHIKSPRAFRPDEITAEVIRLVEEHFPDAPGSLEAFDYPVTRGQARAALRDFIEHRLDGFGRYQDAMVSGQPYLYHSRLSCVLNMHLLHPRELVDAAVDAREDGAPLASVEGFVRQVLGWREFMRGVYWLAMPDYAQRNALGAELPMPAFMWTGDTDMACVRDCVTQLQVHAYTHHIQRLMVLGLFALLLGVRPYDVHRWHMSMYADAIDWVSLPNVLGMSQYADGGMVGSKPYCASGNYIDRMSNYCGGCRYDPKQATGDTACPFTTLYWDFLQRHRDRLAGNHRMGFQLRNLERKNTGERSAISRAANRLREELTRKTWL